MSWVLTFLGIIALIIVHEFGHFAVAKAVGMRVERFSLFFPPILFSVRRGETEYSIGALPLGGYVKIGGMAPVERMPRVARGEGEEHHAGAGMLGELAGDPMPDDPRAYFNQPVWKRVAVIAAGPATNVILAFAILWGVYTFSAQTPRQRSRARGRGAERLGGGLRAAAPGTSCSRSKACPCASAAKARTSRARSLHIAAPVARCRAASRPRRCT